MKLGIAGFAVLAGAELVAVLLGVILLVTVSWQAGLLAFVIATVVCVVLGITMIALATKRGIQSGAIFDTMDKFLE